MGDVYEVNLNTQKKGPDSERTDHYYASDNCCYANSAVMYGVVRSAIVARCLCSNREYAAMSCVADRTHRINVLNLEFNNRNGTILAGLPKIPKIICQMVIGNQTRAVYECMYVCIMCVYLCAGA